MNVKDVAAWSATAILVGLFLSGLVTVLWLRWPPS